MCQLLIILLPRGGIAQHVARLAGKGERQAMWRAAGEDRAAVTLGAGHTMP